MGTIRERAGSYRAEIAIKGVRESRTFKRRADAQIWIDETEYLIRAGEYHGGEVRTFGSLLRRYAEEVSAKKGGSRQEQIRLAAVLGDGKSGEPDPITRVPLSELAPAHFAEWRDRRLAVVQPSSVLREWNVLSPAINVAINEWGWLKENPMAKVKRPEKSGGRERRWWPHEIEAFCQCAGYTPGGRPGTKTARVGWAVHFAIETGMRIGEICALRWSSVWMQRRVLRVEAVESGAGKTLAARRDVPLSDKAITLLAELMPDEPRADLVLGITAVQFEGLFRKVRDRADLADADLVFHDTRHEAITRLSRKLNVLELAKMVGHKNIAQLQTYYNATADELAERLR